MAAMSFGALSLWVLQVSAPAVLLGKTAQLTDKLGILLRFQHYGGERPIIAPAVPTPVYC